MNRFLTTIAAAAALLSFGILCRAADAPEKQSSSASRDSLELTIDDCGISFGNSTNTTGIRLSHMDSDVERVNGLNLTLFADPRENRNQYARHRGLTLGLMAVTAREINGIAVAGGAVWVEERTSWLNLAGGLVRSKGTIDGITVGWFGVWADDNVKGVTGSAGVIYTMGELRGVNVGLAGCCSEGRMVGVNIGSVVGSQVEVEGLSIATLGLFGTQKISGLNISGWLMGSGGRISGLSIAGAGLRADELAKGVMITGMFLTATEAKGVIRSTFVSGDRIVGLNFGHIALISQEFKGLTVGLLNYSKHVQKGLAIGLVNITDELDGVQIGLVNIAHYNPDKRRVLPLINFRF